MEVRYDTVVIGGSGFVGTKLATYLAERGERVLDLSRHISAVPIRGVQQKVIDFSRPLSESERIPEFDTIIILIGQTGPSFDPVADRQALQNLVSLINLRKHPVKVLYSSTALVYGDCSDPAIESDDIKPIESYAKHKAENEAFLLAQIAPQHQLGIFRFSNVFGDIRSKGFIALIMNRLLANPTNVFPINGDGNQERDYIFIDDLIEAIAAVKTKLRGRDIINVGSGESRSLSSVLQSVTVVSGKMLLFEVTHQPIIEARNVRISTERLRSVYGYVPKHTFLEALQLMWEKAGIGKEIHIL